METSSFQNEREIKIRIEKILDKEGVAPRELFKAKKLCRSIGDTKSLERVKNLLERLANEYKLPKNNMKNEPPKNQYTEFFCGSIMRDYAECLTDVNRRNEVYCWAATFWQQLEREMQLIQRLVNPENTNKQKTPGQIFNSFFDEKIFPFNEAKRLEHIIFEYLNWAKHEYMPMFPIYNVNNIKCMITGLNFPDGGYEKCIFKIVLTRHCLADAVDYCKNFLDIKNDKATALRPNIITCY